MKLRLGYISTFIDELHDSLQFQKTAEAATGNIGTLKLYEQEVSAGSIDTSQIFVPVIFAFLEDPEITINKEEAFKYVTGVVNKLNAHLAAANIILKLSRKATVEGDDFLEYPGVTTVDATNIATVKSYYGQFPDGGFGIIEKTFRYFEDGIAAADVNINDNPVCGVNKDRIDEIIEASIDVNNVLTICIANRINTSVVNGELSKYAYQSAIHPALASGAGSKTFYATWSYASIRENDLIEIIGKSADYLIGKTEVSMPNLEHDPYAYHAVSMENNSTPALLHLHNIGNLFGLLPSAIGEYSFSAISTYIADCDSTGCILTEGNGNCVDDLLPYVPFRDFDPYPEKNVFEKFIDETNKDILYTADTHTCDLSNITTPDNMYIINNLNAMHFNCHNIASPSLGFFTNSQISKMRAGFLTENTVLNNIKNSYLSLLNIDDYLEEYCENIEEVGSRSLKKVLKKISFKVLDLKESSLDFMSIEDKIKILCNTILNK